MAKLSIQLPADPPPLLGPSNTVFVADRADEKLILFWSCLKCAAQESCRIGTAKTGWPDWENFADAFAALLDHEGRPGNEPCVINSSIRVFLMPWLHLREPKMARLCTLLITHANCDSDRRKNLGDLWPPPLMAAPIVRTHGSNVAPDGVGR